MNHNDCLWHNKVKNPKWLPVYHRARRFSSRSWRPNGWKLTVELLVWLHYKAKDPALECRKNWRSKLWALPRKKILPSFPFWSVQATGLLAGATTWVWISLYSAGLHINHPQMDPEFTNLLVILTQVCVLQWTLTICGSYIPRAPTNCETS